MHEVSRIYDTMPYGPAPESSAAADAWLDGHQRRFGHFIDGEWRPSDATFATHNPATGDELAQVSQGDAQDVDAAVSAARQALETWRDPAQRSRYLYAMARQLQKHARLFAVLETLDNGKAIRESRDLDIPLAVRHFYHHAGWASLIDERFPNHQPHGVVGQIIPWNFPLLMLAWKIAPALAAGDTVVLKPAESTPLTALRFAELCRTIGLPKGVVNIVTGAGETGAALVRHPDVDKIAFTGSTDVGRDIRNAIAGSAKALTLELGGKSPILIFDDADLDSAVEGVVDAIWFNQGQVCCAGSRLLVQESIADEVHQRLRRRMDQIRLGDPLDKNTDMGPLISTAQHQRVTQLVARAEAEGLQTHRTSSAQQSGLFYPPTLLTNVQPSHEIAQVEVFGPVLTSTVFRHRQEAVALANNTRYGLAACLWTQDVNRAHALARQLKAGTVWINGANRFDAAAPFGGFRDSGFGREGGEAGMRAYLRRIPEAITNSIQADGSGTRSGLDRTAKHYIGGKQTRPDGGYSREVTNTFDSRQGDIPEGNRKDIRNAVAAARKASDWTKRDAHARAQVLYFIAENLEAQADRFEQALTAYSANPKREVAQAVDLLCYYAGLADKYETRVHATPGRFLTYGVHHPHDVIGVLCPDHQPLHHFIAATAPALAMGCRVVAVPSHQHPLVAADLYQVLDTSDLPGGVLNIVFGEPQTLGMVLAAHEEVDALWTFRDDIDPKALTHAAYDLKRLWFNTDIRTLRRGQTFLEQAVDLQTVWTPYGL